MAMIPKIIASNITSIGHIQVSDRGLSVIDARLHKLHFLLFKAVGADGEAMSRVTMIYLHFYSLGSAGIDESTSTTSR